MIKAVVFGASGMIGKAVLLECLGDDRVERVLCIGRSAPDVTHPKLEYIVHEDFETLGNLSDRVKDYRACFYAVGIPSTGLSEEQYKVVTHDLTLRAAEMLLKHNSDLSFCFVSGAGTDSSEKGRSMWARIKGRTENALRNYPFRSVFCFRPAFILPKKGVKSKVRLYRIMYALAWPLYPLLRLFPSITCTSVQLGRAMINAACTGSDKVILESGDIVRLGRTGNAMRTSSMA